MSGECQISGGKLGRRVKNLACGSDVQGYAISELFVLQGKQNACLRILNKIQFSGSYSVFPSHQILFNICINFHSKQNKNKS